jgi:hypothetical protein
MVFDELDIYSQKNKNRNFFFNMNFLKKKWLILIVFMTFFKL